MLLLSVAIADDVPKTSVVDGFWDHWGDGQAELAGYRLTQPRYGQERAGEAVLVFVTETFTDATRVKSDGGHSDEFPVWKLNEIRDFQTGLYDYNAMTSVFVRLDGHDPVGVPTKVAFSSQEWCGHVYDALTTTDGNFERQVHSYFDGEADQRLTGALPEGALYADALPLLVRSWVTALPESAQLHPRLMDLRFEHRKGSFAPASVSMSDPRKTTVPAGSFEVRDVSVTSGSKTWSYAVEVAAPHRIIGWTGPGGESAELTGSQRMKYWNLAGNGQESLRAELGLAPPTWTPVTEEP